MLEEGGQAIGVAALEGSAKLVEAAAQPVQAVQQRFSILKGNAAPQTRV